ncbi:MAG: pyridoxamine 5'-phosphate oxidase family protein [Betaproteobacteria bacterium]|nr:pyridoxamine 5'-phosphate oxidase family protein [Betaproteobacteria bacterium]
MKAFTPTARSKVKRLPKRASYDRETIYGILDAALICHIGYVLGRQPYVTPTAFWREGDAVYWHGSSKSRMLLALEKGPEICLTVTLVDALVVARSGFHKSINYRSAMLYGRPYKVETPQEKLAKMRAFVERLYPGRWEQLRPVSRQELKATTVLGMHIEEASAKVRTGPPVDEEEDYSLPIWGGVIPIRRALGEPENDGRLAPGAGLPPKVRL